ncbi:MAG: 50S ribosomal protein L25 [Armatimonadota bacterium]
MEQVSLTAETREQAGKGAARKLRAEGKIPGVAYGHGTEAVPVLIDERDLLSVAKLGANVVVDLKIDGTETAADTLAILKELQRDPTTDRLLNADFQWISLTERITVSVPLALEGTPIGVEAGGVTEQSLWELEVNVLPTAIPSSIPVPVADLEIGQSLHVRDVVVPEGVEVLSPGEEPVVSVGAPVIEEEPVVEEAIEVEGEEEEGAEEAEVPEEGQEPQPEADAEQ